MQKTMKLALVALVATVTCISTGFAYADTASDAALSGLNAGVALKAGGFGALAGTLLSIFTVINKNQNNSGTEKIDPKKLGANLVIGAAIGFGLSAIGVDVSDAHVQAAMQTIVPLAVSYFFLHAFNLNIRPMFGAWITGKGSTAKTTT